MILKIREKAHEVDRIKRNNEENYFVDKIFFNGMKCLDIFD